jgi:hypothetical protein
MKKLLVLMLVFGVASVANAMTLSLVDGDADTVDLLDSAGYVVGDDVYFAVVGDTSKVAISGGALTAIAPADSGIFGYDAQANGMCAAPLDGMWGSLASIAGTSTGPGVYVDEIAWTLVGGATNADISLITTVDFMTFETIGTINVPEPMTIALMGLGSLFLLRRRK